MTQVDILINNYNYERYIGEAIESVLAQTHTDWRLIVVDDGSRDGSRGVIEQYAAKDDRIIPVFKKNGGQLSAFNVGFGYSQGDFVFFLDADDRFHASYVEHALQIYRQETLCDFLFVAQQFIGSKSDINIIPGMQPGLTDLGFTSYITAAAFLWVGERTSAVSMRRSLAARMFPIALEADWRVQADNCIVWMSSILGGQKFYLPEPLIDYRIHSDNLWFGTEKNVRQEYEFQLRVERFFAHINQRNSRLYSRKYDAYDFALRLHYEARTGKKPVWMLERYLWTISKMDLGLYLGYKMRKRFKRMIERVKVGRSA